LAEDAVAQIRFIIADSIKNLSTVPRDAVLRLAMDTEVRIADPVIRLSPLLTEEDLLLLVASPPTDGTLQAVARRIGIGEAVTDALIGQGDGDTALGEIIPDENAADPFLELREKDLREGLTGLLAVLTPRERTIVRLRYGLGGVRERTLEEIGVKLGITRERIRQIQMVALKKLRREMGRKETVAAPQ
jgi:RNA polymerase primary sigma factor